jgi:hypothetical protein
MIPGGYAYPNATQNCSIANGTKLISKLSRFGWVCTLTIEPFAAGPSAPSRVSIQDAEKAGVLPDDPVALAVVFVGVADAQSAATLLSILEEGGDAGTAFAALLKLAGAVYGEAQAVNRAFNAINSNKAMQTVLAVEISR